MYQWIRQRRRWIATILLVALFPCVVAAGQPLVWCIGADGHSAVEKIHATHKAPSGSQGLAVDAAPLLCADYDEIVPDGFVQARTVSADRVDFGHTTWFVGPIVKPLKIVSDPGMLGPMVPQVWPDSALQHSLSHLRTVILRV